MTCGPAPNPMMVRMKMNTADAVARMAGGTRSWAVAKVGPIHSVLKTLAGRYSNSAHRVSSIKSEAATVGMASTTPIIEM